jgi:hypothetical protein
MHESPKAQPMTEIDFADDDALRYIQRVLEARMPAEVDRQAALDLIRGIRTRVRKVYAARASAVDGVALPPGGRDGQA